MSEDDDLAIAPEAIELILFQRTALLPPRGPASRLLGRFGLGESYEGFVRRIARRDHREIARRYSGMMLAEFQRIAPHIPENATATLDIGCGLAAFDYYLYQHLAEGKPTIHLLDKTRVESQVWYDFKSDGAFYNSLEMAKDMLVANGVPADRIVCIEASGDGAIPLSDASLDLVISTISWGFHYPVSTYAKAVARLLRADGVLILDVRNGTDGADELRRHFGDVREIGRGEKFVTYKCMARS